MLKCITDIQIAKKKKVYIVNLDIKKAYDSVIRSDAREIMRQVGVGEDLINLWHMLNYEPRSDLAVGG